MTTTQQTKLPPLPEKNCSVLFAGGKVTYHSEAAILAYGQLCREQALEDAAKRMVDKFDKLGLPMADEIRSMK